MHLERAGVRTHRPPLSHASQRTNKRDICRLQIVVCGGRFVAQIALSPATLPPSISPPPAAAVSALGRSFASQSIFMIRNVLTTGYVSHPMTTSPRSDRHRMQ